MRSVGDLRRPRIAAFFDYGGTLVAGRHLDAPVRRGHLRTTLMGAHSESDFAATLSAMLSTLAGRTPEQLGADGTEELVNTIAAGIRPQLWTLLRAHREMGHRIVLASSAVPHRAEPAAREIEADHVLCTRLEVIDGRYTGRLAGRPAWGPGKAAAVRALARTYDIDLVASYAYANGTRRSRSSRPSATRSRSLRSRTCAPRRRPVTGRCWTRSPGHSSRPP